MYRLTVAIKFIILVIGIFCIYILMSKENLNSTGIGIAAAGCFIAFALIENNDVNESNKE